MTHDFCLGCGVLLPQRIYDCPICGFDNSFGEYRDLPINESFLNELSELSDEFSPDETA